MRDVVTKAIRLEAVAQNGACAENFSLSNHYNQTSKTSTWRALAMGIAFAATLFGAQTAKAANIKDVAARLAVNVSTDFTRASHYPAVFETSEKRSGKIKPFTKWSGMFKRFERELNNGEAKGVVAQLQKDLGQVRGETSIKKMAKFVNNMMNKKRYINDSKNWGKSDYWATPIEFMQRGGDCEDFAIAKYAALRALGVPEENLRLAIVQDTLKNIPHAVLIVYTEAGPYVLDNQEKEIISAKYAGRYEPIYSINRTAWWLHEEPSATRVASVQ